MRHLQERRFCAIAQSARIWPPTNPCCRSGAYAAKIHRHEGVPPTNVCHCGAIAQSARIRPPTDLCGRSAIYCDETLWDLIFGNLIVERVVALFGAQQFQTDLIRQADGYLARTRQPALMHPILVAARGADKARPALM